MTLNELLIDCCTRLNYPPDLALVDATVKARLTRFLDQTQSEILAQPTYRRILRGHMRIATAPNLAQYGLPGFVSRIVALIDMRRQRRLDAMSTDAYRRYLPNPDTQLGNPVSYAFDGWSSTMRQPREANTEIFVFSPIDTAPTTIHVTTNGPLGPPYPFGTYNESSTIATLDNTLPFPGKLITGLGAIANVSDVYLSVPALSIVSLVEDDPLLPPIAQIQPGHVRARSPQIYLAPTPSGIFLLDLYYEREPEPVTASESILPPRFHFLLGAGARMKEYELRGDTSRYAVARREYDSGIQFLNTWISDQPDAGDQMAPDDGRFGGTSVLGPWFPASGYRGF